MTMRLIPGYLRSCVWCVQWHGHATVTRHGTVARITRPASMGWATEVAERMRARGHKVTVGRAVVV